MKTVLEYLENSTNNCSDKIAVIDENGKYTYKELTELSKKIGTKLMKYLGDIAIREKAINITLEVRQSNFVAIHLYEKMGFSPVAIRKYYYGDEDAILMENKVM